MNAIPAAIVLASGGTGGHMFPAAALAGALDSRGYRLALISDRRGVAHGGMPASVEAHTVPSASPAGGLARKVKAAAELFRGTWAARALLKVLSPAAVVGFGGYASVPAVTAAAMAGRPIVLHEQNAVLGRANRLWAKRAKAIATAFREVAHLPAGARVVETGNPVRAGFASMSKEAYAPPAADGTLNLLILGGSQGATVFSDVLPAALARLAPATRARLSIHQQCRPEDLERVRRAYADIGQRAVLATFFDDVPERLARAHLVVSRSGASTVAELTAAGRPAILVPYPHAMDDHQRHNAEALAAAGAAWAIPYDAFTPETLADRLRAILADPSALGPMADKARALGRADAAERLADLVESVIAEGREAA